MSRHYTTRHYRTTSGYSLRHKNRYKDNYGTFKEGMQISPDRIAGKSLFYRDKEHQNDRRQAH